MAGGRGLGEQLLDVGEEAEVEHLVGLVEHHLAHVAEVEEALAGEVEQTAGRADDDLRAGLELLDLALVGLAAVDGDDVGGAVLGRLREVFEDLHAQLAGGDDDERLHAGLRVETEALDDGEAEAEGLAGSGLRLADDVLAVEGEGDGLRLDGERFDDALGGQSVDHVLVDIEFGESHEVMPVRLEVKVYALFLFAGVGPSIHSRRQRQAYWTSPLHCCTWHPGSPDAGPRSSFPDSSRGRRRRTRPGSICTR